MKRGLIVFATMIALLAGVFVNANSSVRAASINGPQSVTRDVELSIVPRIAQGPDGNLHVVWDEQEDRRVMYAKGVWNGSTYDFGPKYLVSDVDAEFGAATPNLAVAPNGQIMVTWSAPDRNRPIGYAKVWDSRAPGPSSGPIRIGVGIQSAIATDADSRFHIVYNGDFKIQYCLFEGGFDCARRDTFGLNDISNNNPDIVVDSTDAVHLVWHTGKDEVQYTVRQKNANWSEPTKIDGGILASIGADGRGEVHLTWTRDFNILYCRKTAASDCVERRQFDTGDDIRPSIGATPNGDVLLVWIDTRAQVLQYVLRENGNWSSPAQFTDASTSPDVPGRAYVGWTSATWSRDFDIAVSSVYYGAPPVQPQPPVPPTPIPPTPAPLPPGPPPPVQPDARCFPETGYCVYGRLREYWEGNGGVAVFGYPLSNQARLQTPDGIFDVQVFERERLEYRPENPRPFDVLLSRLGAELLARQGRPWETLPREQPRDGCAFFPETGHNMCEPFLSYWRSVGIELGDNGVSYSESLLLFGLPITTRALETNADGATVETQWFERARFEYYPNNPEPYRVLLGRLGAESGGIE